MLHPSAERQSRSGISASALRRTEMAHDPPPRIRTPMQVVVGALSLMFVSMIAPVLAHAERSRIPTASR